MKYIFIAIIIMFFTCLNSCKPTGGCTDKEAINYDITADENDGSCRYCTFESTTTSNNTVTIIGSNSSEPYFGDSILDFDMQVFNSGYSDFSCDDKGKMCSISVKIVNLTSNSLFITGISADYSSNNTFFSFFNSVSNDENFYLPPRDSVYAKTMSISQNGCGVKLDNQEYNIFVSYDFN